VTAAPLKAQNAAWIWAVVAADALVLAAVAFPSSLDQAASLLVGSRIAGAAIAPVIVLLLTSLLSSDAKAALVYWRISDVLPGHRAFSVHAHADPRVDVGGLRAKVGEFPASPREQNTLWYRLLKEVDAEPEVAQAHRHFLLFRDIAALSLLLIVVVAPALYFLGAGGNSVGVAAVLLAVQYLATATAARLHGVRLVRNVLALHAAAGGAAFARPTRAPRSRKVSNG
jgi:hypothetical protein